MCQIALSTPSTNSSTTPLCATTLGGAHVPSEAWPALQRKAAELHGAA